MTLNIRNATSKDRERCMELLQSLASFTGGSTDPRAHEIFDQLLDAARGEVFVAEDATKSLVWLPFRTTSPCDTAASTANLKS